MQPDFDYLHEKARAHLLESAENKQKVAEKFLDSILAAAQLIAKPFQSGGKVLLCGNGGSAADCEHMAAEFVNRLTRDFERPGLPAIADDRHIFSDLIRQRLWFRRCLRAAGTDSWKARRRLDWHQHQRQLPKCDSCDWDGTSSQYANDCPYGRRRSLGGGGKRCDFSCEREHTTHTRGSPGD